MGYPTLAVPGESGRVVTRWLAVGPELVVSAGLAHVLLQTARRLLAIIGRRPALAPLDWIDGLMGTVGLGEGSLGDE